MRFAIAILLGLALIAKADSPECGDKVPLDFVIQGHTGRAPYVAVFADSELIYGPVLVSWGHGEYRDVVYLDPDSVVSGESIVVIVQAWGEAPHVVKVHVQ